MTTVSLVACALASPAAHGQGTLVLASPVGALATTPLDEHLKVQDGAIFVKLPGQSEWDRGSAPATVGHAVKVLRAIYPNATFAIDPRVLDVPVTDVIVRANDPITDLEALQTSCGGRFSIGHVLNINGGPEHNPLYKIEYNEVTGKKTSAEEDRKIECFNLTGYLQRVKAHDENEANPNKASGGGFGVGGGGTPGFRAEQAVARLQDIIQKSISDFDPSISQPHFQFYGDAQLLIVVGPQQAMEVAAKVIHALPSQPTSTSDSFGGGGSADLQRSAKEFERRNLQEMERTLQEMRAGADAMKADKYRSLSPPVPESNPGSKP